MHKTYAPARAPQLLHGSYAEHVKASRSPSAWELSGDSSSWSRTSASSVATDLRMSGAKQWRTRIDRSNRPRTAGSLPRLDLDNVTAVEGERSNRAWNAVAWSPPPRKAKRETKAPPSLDDVKNKNLEADAAQLREYQDQMAGFGPFPDARVERQRQRRVWNQIDRQLREAAEETERSLVHELHTPRVRKKTEAEVKDAEKQEKARRRAETMARNSSAQPAAVVVPVTAGSLTNADVRTEPKRMPSGEIIDPQQHISRPSEASPYKHAVMPERFVKTSGRPDKPPAKITKADGRVLEKHAGAGKFGVDSQEAVMAINILFVAVQADPDETQPLAGAVPSPRPATPGGSIIGLPGYEYDRRPHVIEDVEKLRSEQMIAQQDGDYEKVAALSDKILSLDSPTDYAVVMKRRAEVEAAAAKHRKWEEDEEARLAASEEAAERRRLEEEVAEVEATAAQLVSESAFAEQQQELLHEETRRLKWEKMSPAPVLWAQGATPTHRHSHMWEESLQAPLRPVVRSSPPRNIAFLKEPARPLNTSAENFSRSSSRLLMSESSEQQDHLTEIGLSTGKNHEGKCLTRKDQSFRMKA